MSPALSPPKVVLLAAHCTATGDIASLASLAAQNSNVLHKELLLRLLLTYLPTHLKTADYLPLLQSLDADDFSSFFPLADVDAASVDGLSDDQATKKVRKLRLHQLSLPDSAQAPPPATDGNHNNHNNHNNNKENDDDDTLALFLILRAYAVDDGAGALPELPSLVAPFLDRSARLRTWAISTLLPLLRRNCEYYPEAPVAQTLADFEHLPDRLAVARLLSQTGVRDEHAAFVGRDLRGLIGPWLYNARRWTTAAASSSDDHTHATLCPGWEEVLQWLINQAGKSWRVAVGAVEQWDGPGDADLGGFGRLWMDEAEQGYLERRYARAALACVYLIPETSFEALSAAHGVVSKIRGLCDQGPLPPLQTAASLLSPASGDDGAAALCSATSAVYLRNDLLDESNVLTAPSPAATGLLHALIISAFLLSRLGSPCTLRRVGELVLLCRGREQKSELTKVIHWIAVNGPKSEDKYWIKARNEILWLRDWGAASQTGNGVFGQVNKAFVEAEILKALLANGRYALARSLYEDAPDHPLPPKAVQDTVFAAALSAYDNASNPNRTRGGLKKCDDMIHAFPQTIDGSLVPAQRTAALLAATHALSSYRLVLKQGEPFTPVVLRVHPDPISIVGRVLEQNPKSYTRIQQLIDVATSMVAAGLTVRDRAGHSALTPELEPVQCAMAERRVTAMCIDAALNEDDFETAYSYVVGRVAALAEPSAADAAAATAAAAASGGPVLVDSWSWRAALEAGKYRRTERTLRPTHLGTATANLAIRHLEQRIECLATALRIAPSDTLQEILSAYRRCEEELEAAVLTEAEQEQAWEAEAEAAGQGWSHPKHRQHTRVASSAMPGGFAEPTPAPASAPMASRIAAAAKPQSAAAAAAAADDAPLSLFDLSRATARAAQRNLSALSSLRQTRQAVFGFGGGEAHGQDEKGDGRPPVSAAAASADADADADGRVRKRDQLRDAAMGTLTTGVGWLIGAQPVGRNEQRE